VLFALGFSFQVIGGNSVSVGQTPKAGGRRMEACGRGGLATSRSQLARQFSTASRFVLDRRKYGKMHPVEVGAQSAL
jgi:hypothetical protein